MGSMPQEVYGPHAPGSSEVWIFFFSQLIHLSVSRACAFFSCNRAKVSRGLLKKSNFFFFFLAASGYFYSVTRKELFFFFLTLIKYAFRDLAQITVFNRNCAVQLAATALRMTSICAESFLLLGKRAGKRVNRKAPLEKKKKERVCNCYIMRRSARMGDKGQVGCAVE